MAGVSDPGYRFVGAKSHLQQARTARFLRGIWRNGRAALSAESARGGHFIAGKPFYSNTARKFSPGYEHNAAPHLRQTRLTFIPLACRIMKIVRQTMPNDIKPSSTISESAAESGVKPPHSKAASPRRLSCPFVSIRG